jgi:hypothetical protein
VSDLIEIEIEDFDVGKMGNVVDGLDAVVRKIEFAQRSETLQRLDFVDFVGEGR